ncbi:hypothetical protein [Rhodococcus wratislaviensis]|nr:hypothetical protein [Rhodococcus wratislaviensis]
MTTDTLAEVEQYGIERLLDELARAVAGKSVSTVAVASGVDSQARLEGTASVVDSRCAGSDCAGGVQDRA